MVSRLRLPIIAIYVLLFTLTPSLKAQNTSDYWPTNGWRTSSPESQGMDSGLLAALLAHIIEDNVNVHSVLVIRHGYLVTEAYRYPYQPDTLHSIQSCTKSITSTLVGLAIQQGYIEGVEQPVLDFFPQQMFDHLDDAKRALTLEHVLTMQSGLVADRDVRTPGWQSDRDFIQDILDRPMNDQPGTYWIYNGLSTQVLASIVAETSALSVADFAAQYLFEPLGIQNFLWQPMGGIVNAGSGLWLTPQDMAKIGYLFLKNGQWEEAQLLPPEWVMTSTTAHVRDIDRIAQIDNYGYQWWVDDSGYYAALGAGGQAIFVHPDLDLIAVFTSSIPSNGDLPIDLFNSFIIPAVQSETSLPENQENLATLETQIEILAQPHPTPVPPLPATAEQISNQVYSLEDNSSWASLMLTFDLETAEAVMLINGEGEFHIGLDGVFRINTLSGIPQLLKGQWVEADTFAIEWATLGSAYFTELTLRFEGETVIGRLQYHGYDEILEHFSGVVAE